jgi:hypothetical protein
MANWQNRIIGEGLEDADRLLANPANWRIHPKHQQDALAGVLDSVGWVQRVIVNKRTGFVVDGHMRVALAITHGEQVPVSYVDLSEADEQLILATLDPISAMAGADASKLDELLAQVNTDNAAIQEMLAGLAEGAGLYPDVNLDATPESIPSQYMIMIECATEAEQSTLLERFVSEGIKCRALIS